MIISLLVLGNIDKQYSYILPVQVQYGKVYKVKDLNVFQFIYVCTYLGYLNDWKQIEIILFIIESQDIIYKLFSLIFNVLLNSVFMYHKILIKKYNIYYFFLICKHFKPSTVLVKMNSFDIHPIKILLSVTCIANLPFHLQQYIFSFFCMDDALCSKWQAAAVSPPLIKLLGHHFPFVLCRFTLADILRAPSSILWNA